LFFLNLHVSTRCFHVHSPFSTISCFFEVKAEWILSRLRQNGSTSLPEYLRSAIMSRPNLKPTRPYDEGEVVELYFDEKAVDLPQINSALAPFRYEAQAPTGSNLKPANSASTPFEAYPQAANPLQPCRFRIPRLRRLRRSDSNHQTHNLLPAHHQYHLTPLQYRHRRTRQVTPMRKTKNMSGHSYKKSGTSR
jgi:hypothetical protein